MFSKKELAFLINQATHLCGLLGDDTKTNKKELIKIIEIAINLYLQLYQINNSNVVSITSYLDEARFYSSLKYKVTSLTLKYTELLLGFLEPFTNKKSNLSEEQLDSYLILNGKNLWNNI